MTPGQRLRAARLRKGWSQKQLAEHSGTAVMTVSRIECGYPFRDSTLAVLLSALGVGKDLRKVKRGTSPSKKIRRGP